jgi:hydrogenase nickel incorporation protein HypA/HybF
MHEYGIAESILKGTLKKMEEHGLKKVDSVKLRLGRLNMLTQSALQEAFDIVSKGSTLEGTRLEVEEVDGSEIASLELAGESEDNS